MILGFLYLWPKVMDRKEGGRIMILLFDLAFQFFRKRGRAFLGNWVICLILRFKENISGFLLKRNKDRNRTDRMGKQYIGRGCRGYPTQENHPHKELNNPLQR